MFDLDAIRKRAQQASEHAADSIRQTMEKSEALTARAKAEAEAAASAVEAEGQVDAGSQRQVEILGQTFDPANIAQMAAGQELLRESVQKQAAAAAERALGQLLGEDMGVLAAALEMLEMEDGGEDGDTGFSLELEQRLCAGLDEAMTRLESLPEPEPVPYPKDSPSWERFGILLSGIVSSLNGHSLDGMDVEEHIPVLEQRVVSIVRRSWGIDGRGGLLDMLRYLTQEGYTLRYRRYAGAAAPEELMDGSMDEEDRASAARAWRFVQRYKGRYAPGFLTGWDVGRAAMLTRWGCYLGWITGSEAEGILWDLSQWAARELHSWREFARSYLFGGLMWKLLCGDCSAGSYLSSLTDAAAGLLAGAPEQGGGQWRSCPWPAQRKNGFAG